VAGANEYKIGKTFDISDLRKPKAVRQPSPRDEAIGRAINQAATAPESQVVPLHLPISEKLGTAKAAAVRQIKARQSPVNVGISATHPNTLLFSRGVLSKRSRRSS